MTQAAPARYVLKALLVDFFAFGSPPSLFFPFPPPNWLYHRGVWCFSTITQITKRTDQFWLAGKIHQGAIDFINCSGESVTGLPSTSARLAPKPGL